MTRTELANRALRHAKLSTINSLNDDTETAAYINEIFNDTSKEALTDGNFDWAFARRRRTLNQVVVTFGEWTYAHDLPDDMAQLQKLIPTDYKEDYALPADQYRMFEYRDDADRSGIRVASEHENLDAQYIGLVISVPYMPIGFANALSWLLGYYLADAFGTTERAVYCKAIYEQEIKKAKVQSQKKDFPGRKGAFTLIGESDAYP